MSGGKSFRGVRFGTGARRRAFTLMERALCVVRDAYCVGGSGARAGTLGCRRAFTLIELLVVVSVIGMLMALLLPALSRARKRARAVACQARLRQAGAGILVAVENNDGRLPDIRPGDGASEKGRYAFGLFHTHPPFTESPELALCPSAARHIPRGPFFEYGSTFSAYRAFAGGESITGSYAQNLCVAGASPSTVDSICYTDPYTTRGTSRVPYLLDSAFWWVTAVYEPPQYEDQAFDIGIPALSSCINRHQGGVNALFLDWSVRKVGLKELWTLRWSRKFDTTGPWTKAGGVLPEDWPEWMRGFKDY